MNLLTKCLLASIATIGFAAPLAAQDLTDNETCLECHEGVERSAPADPDMVQVHNPEGGFFAEAHEMWSCVDCHDYVTELPHAEDVADQKVDCLNCHEEVPKK